VSDAGPVPGHSSVTGAPAPADGVIRCPTCRGGVEPHQRFCTCCGVDLPPAAPQVPARGAPRGDGCGHSLLLLMLTLILGLSAGFLLVREHRAELLDQLLERLGVSTMPAPEGMQEEDPEGPGSGATEILTQAPASPVELLGQPVPFPEATLDGALRVVPVRRVRGSTWVEGHPPEAATDGDGRTYWQPLEATRRWLELELEGETLLRRIVFLPGLLAEPGAFQRCGRMQAVSFTFSDGTGYSLVLEDQPEAQSLLLDPPVRASRVTMVILGSLPGDQVPECAVPEVLLLTW
jgi:hypothetical protein